MTKQVRFTQLIKSSGRPHSATLWAGDPNDDPEFKKAIAENRLLTIQNVNVGNKKESGEIGFVKKGSPSYLVFPKALPMAAGTKVIGLKFDQLDQPAVKDPVTIKPAPRKPQIERVKTIAEPAANHDTTEIVEQAQVETQPRHAKKKELPKADAPLRFNVTLEFRAVVSREVEVRANTAAEAIALALKQAASLKPKHPEWRTEAMEVKALK